MTRPLSQALFRRDSLPQDFFVVEGLDLANDLVADPLESEWFVLGASLFAPSDGMRRRNIIRQCFLVRPALIGRTFKQLSYVGDVTSGLGLPAAYTLQRPGERETFHYRPAYDFDLNYSGIHVEPLVSERSGEQRNEFIINPDLWLYLGLEETHRGAAIWVEPRSGREVLRERTDTDGVRVVEIQRDRLLRYLRDRQRALVVGHYADVRIDSPTDEQRNNFVPRSFDLERIRPYRAKVMLYSSVLNDGSFGRTIDALHQRMHLWFCIRPPELEAAPLWQDDPPFDVRAFTLPTSRGDVAPARFRASATENDTFAGDHCDFMSPVFFRQEVLEYYQDSSTYSVDDDGSIHCGSFWGLYRSTRLHGNEYLSTSIGDFAEGVPYDEWPHWRQHAVAPPALQALRAASSEKTVPEAVKGVIDALEGLNAAFSQLINSLGLGSIGMLWVGDADSLAGRRLKRFYGRDAADDLFLERATLLATLVIDELDAAPIRRVLQQLGPQLHQSFDDSPRTLQSRTLLQRLALVKAMQVALGPDIAELPSLLRRAECFDSSGDPTLLRELRDLHAQVRSTFTPLAHLYDLRNAGGIAHRPNLERVGAIMQGFGLSRDHWRRPDYLRLLEIVSDGLQEVTRVLRRGIT